MNWTQIVKELIKTSIGGITQPLFIYGLIFNLLGVLVCNQLGIDNWVVYLLFGIGSMLMATAIIMFIWLCVRNIDKLRSEKFEIEKHKTQK